MKIEQSNFKSLKHKILNIVKKSLNDTDTALDIYTSDDIYFRDSFKKITGKNVSIWRGRADHNFPEIYKSGIQADLGLSMKISSGSSEYRKHSRDVVGLKGKGEFLERLSTMLPLDECVKVGFDRNKFILADRKKIVIKKITGFGYKKIEADKVYYGFRRNSSEISKEKYQPTTNACGAHFDFDKAVLGAWLELIQRDSFLMYWLNTIGPKKIDIEKYIAEKEEKNVSPSQDFKDIKNILIDIKKYNLKCYLLDITSNIDVPAVCSVIEFENKGERAFVLGASAGFNTEATILNAVTESLSVAVSQYNKDATLLKNDYTPFSGDKIGREERISLYLSEKNYDKFKFFIENKEKISVENWASAGDRLEPYNIQNNVKKQLDLLKNIFKEKAKEDIDYNVYFYEFKNKLLKHFDYKVVRVMCKKMYSLYLNENLANPEHPRLSEFVKNKKLEKVAKLNIWPHPFP